MNLKKCFPLIYAFIAYSGIINNVNAQMINQYFFGQNAWYSIYTSTGSSDTYLYPRWSDIKASGAHFVRIGGNNFNLLNTPNRAKIVDLIDQIRNNQMEPIMSVSFPNSGNNNSNLTADAAAAASLITDINTTGGPNGSTYYRNVQYWIIANEPDQCITCLSGYQQGYSYDGSPSTEIQLLADYIKTFSIEMKKIDNTINIIGPEISYYRSNLYTPLFVDGTGSTTSDISGTIPSTYNSVSTAAAYGKPFIDELSIHIYPNDFSSGTSTANRATAIAQLQIPETTSGSLRWQLKQLNNQLATINTSTRGTNRPLSLVITETNVDYLNEGSTTQPSITEGNDNRSFLGGQWWAEWMGVLMEYKIEWVNFWSAVEDNNGYMNYAGDKRSTYWHYQLMANNFKGTYLGSYYIPSTNYKAFAYENSATLEIGVLLMNQDLQTTPTRGTDYSTVAFRINFDNTTPSETFGIKLNLEAPPSTTTYACKIMKESTVLLVFDAITGALKRRISYSLQDALRSVDTGNENVININSDYSAYSNTHSSSDITIGTGTSISASAPKDFKATNSILLNGVYSSNNYTLTLEIDSSCP